MEKLIEVSAADKSILKLSVFKPKRPRKSTRKRRPEDCGPWLHPSGRWCRKIGKRFFYFGRDREEAYREWDRTKSYLLKGQEPLPKPTADSNPAVDGQPGNPTLRFLCNAFDKEKSRLAATGELSQRTLWNYRQSTDALIQFFGKHKLCGSITASDFGDLREALSKGRNVFSLKGHVLVIRMVFKFGYDQGLLANPVRYGQSFKIPDRTALRRSRQAGEKRMFSADELRRVIAAAPATMNAMILLGVNCGFGNGDCASLPQSAVDFKTGWVDFPRPKTAVERRCPLWPETVAALREAIAERPDARDPAHDGLCFLTHCGLPWIRVYEGGAPSNAVAAEFAKLLVTLGMKRSRLNFYALRHTFQTIGEGARDLVAVKSIMGHTDASMSALYREHIADERLQAVVDHVRAWLFPKQKQSRRGKSA